MIVSWPFYLKRKHMNCMIPHFRGSQTFLAYGFLSVLVMFPTPPWQTQPIDHGPPHRAFTLLSPSSPLSQNPSQSPGRSPWLTGVGTQSETYLSSLEAEKRWRGRLTLGWEGPRGSKDDRQREFRKHVYISGLTGKMTGDFPLWNNSNRYWSLAAVICFLALVLSYSVYF